MRIGILGGTFNPIHIGHLILAEESYFELNLTRLIFVPAFIPPHKTAEAIIDPKHRLKMVWLATEDNPAFEVSAIEIESRKTSYSADTLKTFRRIYGENTKLYFITGSDSLKDLFSWKNVNDIFRISKFIVANRPGYPVKDVPREAQTVVITPIEISSENIRKRIKEGKSIRYLVPDKVRRYILENNLYK